MKIRFMLLTAILTVVSATRSQSQTLNWGNEVLDGVTDSNGVTLDDTFVFELGAFVENFTPDETNTHMWFENWRVFDQAAYNSDTGNFTSTVFIGEGVTSSYLAPGSLSFSGLEAYIWIRKGEEPIEGSEWLLVRSEDWTFPVEGGDCCDTNVISWSVSQLDANDDPEWGRQGGVMGPGTYTQIGSSGLQTFTFVPEPSSALMAALAGFGTVLRRRRTA
ncbi:MAG: PEP-CTERM sorting domain-containing protein [Luteolibacter sp.]|jgi:hypothetical protein|nr:PEP-CTERM sorting domain-containing protein [Luteolibacter sp.]